MEERKNNILIYAALIVIFAVLGVIIGYYLFNNNISNKDKLNNTPVNNIDENSYINIVINDKKVLRKELNITDNAIVSSSKVINNLGIVFLDVEEVDFQFETHYLFCFDKDGKLVFEARDFKDNDNDNNRYKYNGKFDFNEENNILTFYTDLFLGESDEATGTAFNDKFLSELTKDEKIKLGNYSDIVKYEYKYENNKMTFVQKGEVSKLKDNEYYKNELNY